MSNQQQSLQSSSNCSSSYLLDDIKTEEMKTNFVKFLMSYTKAYINLCLNNVVLEFVNEYSEYDTPINREILEDMFWTYYETL